MIPPVTLGCIQLPTDLTLDAEGPALVRQLPGVRLRLQKLSLDGPDLNRDNYASAKGQIAKAAATLLPIGSLSGLGLACTSLATTLGADQVQTELRSAHPDAVVTDMGTALFAAVRHLNGKHLAVLSPYVDELHQDLLTLMNSNGWNVVADGNLGLSSDEEITRIEPREIFQMAKELDQPQADVVVLACSAFRACEPGFLDHIEGCLGKPVVSSQQAFLWHLLKLAGIEEPIHGYGQLFSGKPAFQNSVSIALAEAQVGQPDEDVYPSRVPSPTMVARVDPVTANHASTNGPLDPETLARFDRQGAVVLPKMFSVEEVQFLNREITRLRDFYESDGPDDLNQAAGMRIVAEEDDASGDAERTLKSIWQVHLSPKHAPHLRQFGEIARRTTCDSRLVDTAKQVLGEDVYVHQSRIDFQSGMRPHGRHGSGSLWHQDFEQWHCEDGMPRMRAVSMAVLLEPATPENGALMVIPGSHQRLIQAYPARTPSSLVEKNALSTGPELPVKLFEQQAQRLGIEYCTGEPGDVLLLDCNIVHGSHSNISPWGRCMFFVVYNAVSNTLAESPYAAAEPRPEHLGSRDPRFAGNPLSSVRQSLADSGAKEGIG